MKQDAFCFDCQCGWQHIASRSMLAKATQEYEGYCPKCGQKTITYVELNDALYRFDAKLSEWVMTSNPAILNTLHSI